MDSIDASRAITKQDDTNLINDELISINVDKIGGTIKRKWQCQRAETATITPMDT